MWLYLGIASAFFLGIYDVSKKWSLRDNAVLHVLFLSTCFGALVTSPVFILSRFLPAEMSSIGLFAQIPSLKEHLYIGIKTVLVSISWISAYFALKHLPISIVSPIRASSPLWTLLGAILLFGETFQPIHWVAIFITFVSYFAFSVIGKKEGIVFSKNPWILLVAVATLTGALSGLYDKHLLHNVHIDPITLQVWFSFYLVVFNGMVLLIYRRMSKKPASFEWRFTIPLIGIFLIVADYLYFRSLSSEDALIGILSLIRRGSVLISFVAGGIIFKEKNKRKKFIPLLGVLIGIVLLVVSA